MPLTTLPSTASTAQEQSLPWHYERKWRFPLELAGILATYAAYEWVRAQLGRAGVAQRNAKWIVDAEKWMHLLWERDVQQLFLPHKTWLQFLHIYYGTVHFIIPLLVLWGLWKRVPSQYFVWRNRIVATTLLALIGFWLFPVAPPRLLPPHFGFVDTEALYGGTGPLGHGNLKDTNLYAAMPSLHVGWAVWCAAAAMPVLRTTWTRALAWAYPAFTFATVTVTGNHYWLDGFAGVAVDIAGYYVGTWITRLTLRNEM